MISLPPQHYDFDVDCQLFPGNYLIFVAQLFRDALVEPHGIVQMMSVFGDGKEGEVYFGLADWF